MRGSRGREEPPRSSTLNTQGGGTSAILPLPAQRRATFSVACLSLPKGTQSGSVTLP
jgi:hypothetical protein